MKDYAHEVLTEIFKYDDKMKLHKFILEKQTPRYLPRETCAVQWRYIKDKVDREKCFIGFDNFKILHDKEINRLRNSKKNIASMGI